MTLTTEQNLPVDSLATLTNNQGRREAEAFRNHLRGLPEKGWLRQSFCTDWTIKDVVEHQVIQGLAFRDAVRQTIKGQELADLFGVEVTDYKAQIFDLNRLELADRLAETSHELYDLIDAASPEQLEQTIPTRLGPMRLRDVGSTRLSELSLHSWDVRAVNDLTAKVSRESLPLLFPGLMTILPALVHQQTALDLQPAPITYQFELSGAVKGPLSLSIGGGKLKIGRDWQDEAEVRLKLDSEAFLRLAWGRLRVDWMIRDGWIKLEGDKDAALKLNGLFQGL